MECLDDLFFRYADMLVCLSADFLYRLQNEVFLVFRRLDGDIVNDVVNVFQRVVVHFKGQSVECPCAAFGAEFVLCPGLWSSAAYASVGSGEN